MVLEIIYSMYTLAGLAALGKQLHEYLSQRYPDTPVMTATLNRLNLSIEIATKAVGVVTPHPLTRTIRTADRDRDNIYISLKDLVVKGTRRKQQAYQSACKALQPIFEKNNLQLYDLSYADETIAIDSLLNDLAEPAAAAHLATIHAAEWTQELKDANIAFEELYRQRSEDMADDDTPTDKVAVMGLKDSMEMVRYAVASLKSIEEPGIDETIQAVNQYIKQANAIARR